MFLQPPLCICWIPDGRYYSDPTLQDTWIRGWIGIWCKGISKFWKYKFTIEEKPNNEITDFLTNLYPANRPGKVSGGLNRSPPDL